MPPKVTASSMLESEFASGLEWPAGTHSLAEDSDAEAIVRFGSDVDLFGLPVGALLADNRFKKKSTETKAFEHCHVPNGSCF